MMVKRLTEIQQPRNPTSKKSPVELRYIKGVSEHKLLKERVLKPLYHIPCDLCDAFYIVKLKDRLRHGFLEKRKPSSNTLDVSRHIHIDNIEYQVDMDEVKILAAEPRWFTQGVREVFRIEQSSLNKDGGRYNSHSIWTGLNSLP